VSLHADTPNIYNNWFANNAGGGANQVISFYNVNDYALQRSVWQVNQLLKPDQAVLEGLASWDYHYSGGSLTAPPPWSFNKTLTLLGIPQINFNVPTVTSDCYEVMAFAGQSYTTALGATLVENNVTGDVDLSKVWPPDLVHPTHQFDEHFYHSAEFRGDYWQQRNYWNELLGPNGFNITVP
jgi:hypothetical protein